MSITIKRREPKPSKEPIKTIEIGSLKRFIIGLPGSKAHSGNVFASPSMARLVRGGQEGQGHGQMLSARGLRELADACDEAANQLDAGVVA